MADLVDDFEESEEIDENEDRKINESDTEKGVYVFITSA